MKGAIQFDREQHGAGGGKKKEGRKAQKRFKARVLSGSFDFSPANKGERYILPTPLEMRAVPHSEELIREDGRFSAN